MRWLADATAVTELAPKPLLLPLEQGPNFATFSGVRSSILRSSAESTRGREKEREIGGGDVVTPHSATNSAKPQKFCKAASLVSDQFALASANVMVQCAKL